MASSEQLSNELAVVQEEMAETHYFVEKRLGAGAFAVTFLLQNHETGEKVAGKFIPRGPQIDVAVEREIVNHRMLLHQNVIRFREVLVTSRSLCIVLDYATAGELFQYVKRAGCLIEGHARYFFQQLVSGVSYSHDRGISHRDLKLENALIHVSPNNPPVLKVCDFGFSKHAENDSKPKSVKGTVEYLAPEVVLCSYLRQYDACQSDVWSCGVILYLMLCGCYPYGDAGVSINESVRRTVNVQYSFPPHLVLSEECRDLIRRIFVKDPRKRITISGIKQHIWFQTMLPAELQGDNVKEQEQSSQTDDEIRRIVAIAHFACNSHSHFACNDSHSREVAAASQPCNSACA